jgi:hypothetical protein
VHENGLDHGANRVLALHVEVDQRGARLGRQRRRHEVAPELVDEKALVRGVADAQAHRVGVVEGPRLAEDRLEARVVAGGVEAKVGRTDVVDPGRAPAGQRPRVFAHVVFGVRVAGVVGGAERKELHHLARVVLVRRLLGVVDARQPDQHRRIGCHRQQQIGKRPQPLLLEELRLLDRQLL